MKESKFYFRGGHLALDFVNTVGNRLADETRRDYFQHAADVLQWASEAGVPLGSGNGSKERRAGDLKRATAFREALYRIFLAKIARRKPRPEDVALLNRFLERHARRKHLQASRGVYRWHYEVSANVDWVLEHVAEAAGDLLTSREIAHLCRCQGEGCGWLFLDHSRNQPRKWCSMEDCGNRAKAKRHYRRVLRQ